jgi:type II secretory ATPase GspE/PulE/Tfp pilus assembly ATPase PilB-like protein
MKDADKDGLLHINVNDMPPEQAVQRVIEHAAELQVSDLFFTTNEKHVAVQARHLGILRLLSIMSVDVGRKCMSHIKAMAGMDLGERRRPLDGRWIYTGKNGSTIDLRINTIPTLYGEDFTLRLLSRDTQLLELEKLGMLRTDHNRLLQLLNTPSGLILVTGPTGSGKSTTLYTCLTYLNNGEKKINTIEDPVEYSIDGIRQSQINPRIDVGFADLLRGVLRQAPDVVMIGEIRDPVTAETAVRAANSGHLVLSTLHAPVAAGAIQSMLGLGVHPHFLSSSLLGVLAQRLVRTLCPHCKMAFDLSDSPQTFEEVRQWLEPDEGKTFYGPKGCDNCRMQGYAGRTGVFEVLAVSRNIRKAILAKQPTQVIRTKAIEEGMIEFRQSALLKVARGETSIEEVFRAVPAEYLGLDDD